MIVTSKKIKNRDFVFTILDKLSKIKNKTVVPSEFFSSTEYGIDINIDKLKYTECDNKVIFTGDNIEIEVTYKIKDEKINILEIFVLVNKSNFKVFFDLLYTELLIKIKKIKNLDELIKVIIARFYVYYFESHNTMLPEDYEIKIMRYISIPESNVKLETDKIDLFRTKYKKTKNKFYLSYEITTNNITILLDLELPKTKLNPSDLLEKLKNNNNIKISWSMKRDSK